jgi:hypothetical protein
LRDFSLAYNFVTPVISTPAEAFGIMLGFGSNSAASTTNGVFLTSDATNFIAVNKLSNVSQTTILAPIDTLWHNYKVSLDATGCTHTFDGIEKRMTNNLPLSQGMGIGMSILKSAGLTARLLQVDSVQFTIY